MKKVILAVLVALLILFILGFIYWPKLEPKIQEIYQPKEEVEIEIKEEPIQENHSAAAYIKEAQELIVQNPTRSWKLLEEAVALEPSNVEARLLRSQLLEAASKMSQAEMEYQALKESDLNNPEIAYRYADFQMRQGRPDKAWDIVSHFPNSNYTPLALQRITLAQFYKPFSNEVIVFNLPKEYQGSFWVNLVQTLANQEHAKAYQLLKNNPYRLSSWNPELELNLLRVLSYQNSKNLAINEEHEHLQAAKKLLGASDIYKHAMTRDLSTLAELQETNPYFHLTADEENFLNNQEIFAILFAAGGYREAALTLHKIEEYPNYFPDWAIYAMTDSLHQNRGEQEALNFANKQAINGELATLIGELYMKTNQYSKAIEVLEKIAKQDDIHKEKVVLLLGNAYLQEQNLASLKQLIHEQRESFETTAGQELLGRLALIEERYNDADAIYSAIQSSSAEAKRYLAKRAMAKQNWAEAKKLTEELLVIQPNHPAYKRDLEKITMLSEQ